MHLFGIGVERNLIKFKKYYQYSAQLNNTEALFTLGTFYSEGIIFDIDISKAIHYFNKCKEIKNEKNKRYTLSPPNVFCYSLTIKYNYLFYRSLNDLGLIYLTVFDDIEKAIDNIKESAFGEYPFAQNNYGLLYQFYLNNLENAEHFYKRSSKHQFALAEYNLGYLKEQEGKTEEAIEYYIRASEHEDYLLKFQNVTHYDNQLIISIRFIIFYTKLKLSVYYFQKSKLEECKQYFTKAFSKFLDLNNISVQDQIKYTLNTKGNIFSFLKLKIFWQPIFYFVNQPNFISIEELIKIINQSQLRITIIKSRDLFKDINQKEKVVFNFNDELYNFLMNTYFKQDLIQKDLYFISDKETTKTEKKKQSMKEMNNCGLSNDQKKMKNSNSIFKDLGELFDIIVKDPNFLKEMNEIIRMIYKILYKPPYSILFGRISIAKPKPIEDLKRPKDISQMFFEGFDIN